MVTILGPKKGIPIFATLRIQRWALISQANLHDIVYRTSEDHCRVNYMSRVPRGSSDLATETIICYISRIDDMPVNAQEREEQTRKDPVLAQVSKFCMHKWPEVI